MSENVGKAVPLRREEEGEYLIRFYFGQYFQLVQQANRPWVEIYLKDKYSRLLKSKAVCIERERWLNIHNNEKFKNYWRKDQLAASL